MLLAHNHLSRHPAAAATDEEKLAPYAAQPLRPIERGRIWERPNSGNSLNKMKLTGLGKQRSNSQQELNMQGQGQGAASTKASLGGALRGPGSQAPLKKATAKTKKAYSSLTGKPEARLRPSSGGAVGGNSWAQPRPGHGGSADTVRLAGSSCPLPRHRGPASSPLSTLPTDPFTIPTRAPSFPAAPNGLVHNALLFIQSGEMLDMILGQPVQQPHRYGLGHGQQGGISRASSQPVLAKAQAHMNRCVPDAPSLPWV
jgi:hypothetical protein